MDTDSRKQSSNADHVSRHRRNAEQQPQQGLLMYKCYGNRTSVSKSGSGAGSIPLDGLASLVYTNAQSQTVSNRITTAGYEYDPAGNQTRGETSSGVWRRHKYDSAGRLAVVADDGGSPLETYSYGASNERLMTVYGNNLGAPATYYCWEGGQVIADFRAGTSSNLVWEKSYVYLGGRLLATTDLYGTKYHHPDRLGTRLVTDGANGTVTTEQVNLPYGTALTSESSGGFNNRRFTSYDRSATTGMDYAVNRFYNSAQGRFNQVDPIGMGAVSLSNPQSLNLYGYCENDPINHVDPYGLFLGKLFGWIGGVIKKVAKVFAVVLAVAAVLAFSWGFAAIGIQALIGAGIFAAIGWGSGKLSEFAGAFLGTLGKGGNFRTPPINGSVGAGAITAFQAAHGSRKPSFTNIFGKLYAIYNDVLEAILSAIDTYNPPSRRKHREYGGNICAVSPSTFNGPPRFIYTVVKGTRASVQPNDVPCPTGTRRVGAWHTHGGNDPNYDNEIFSPDDRIWANDNYATGVSAFYVVTPGRRIRVFYPAGVPGTEQGSTATFTRRSR